MIGGSLILLVWCGLFTPGPRFVSSSNFTLHVYITFTFTKICDRLQYLLAGLFQFRFILNEGDCIANKVGPMSIQTPASVHRTPRASSGSLTRCKQDGGSAELHYSLSQHYYILALFPAKNFLANLQRSGNRGHFVFINITMSDDSSRSILSVRSLAPGSKRRVISSWTV